MCLLLLERLQKLHKATVVHVDGYSCTLSLSVPLSFTLTVSRLLSLLAFTPVVHIERIPLVHALELNGVHHGLREKERERRDVQMCLWAWYSMFSLHSGGARRIPRECDVDQRRWTLCL